MQLDQEDERCHLIVKNNLLWNLACLKLPMNVNYDQEREKCSNTQHLYVCMAARVQVQGFAAGPRQGEMLRSPGGALGRW